jgi:hypothetical protein
MLINLNANYPTFNPIFSIKIIKKKVSFYVEPITINQSNNHYKIYIKEYYLINKYLPLSVSIKIKN